MQGKYWKANQQTKQKNISLPAVMTNSLTALVAEQEKSRLSNFHSYSVLG